MNELGTEQTQKRSYNRRENKGANSGGRVSEREAARTGDAMLLSRKAGPGAGTECCAGGMDTARSSGLSGRSAAPRMRQRGAWTALGSRTHHTACTEAELRPAGARHHRHRCPRGCGQERVGAPAPTKEAQEQEGRKSPGLKITRKLKVKAQSSEHKGDRQLQSEQKTYSRLLWLRG